MENTLKKNFYIWHRYLGIVTCAVVFAWSLSGALHPLMSWFQPRPAKMMIDRPPLRPGDFGVSPEQALMLNRIGTYEDFNVVSFDEGTYYQVRTGPDRELLYFDTRDGVALAGGDEKYAVWLARNYLQDFSSPVSAVSVVSDFDREYKVINKLLPVYRVGFERDDQMRAYVDTSSGMLGTLINGTKGKMMAVFVNLHNWDWVGVSDRLRIGLLVTFASLVVVMALSGLIVYGLFWKTFRPLTGSMDTPRNRLKRYHRVLGLTVSVTMMLWGASAAYHAIEKPDILAEARTRYATQEFGLSDAGFPLAGLVSDTAGQPVVNVSMVRINGQSAYQVFRADRHVSYHDSTTGALIPGANDRYLRQLAGNFSGLDDSAIVSIRPVTKFDKEYGFINKRLPVVRVEYNDTNRTRYFVEPVAGLLALELGDRKRLESYSFNILHKWSFLDWSGRMTRDVIMIIFVTLQAVLSGSGLVMFVMWRRVTGRRQAKVGASHPTGG